MEKENHVHVKTTGAFELRDPISDITIGNKKAVEVPETSFVTQMIALKRLKVVSGEVKQETVIPNKNPATEPLPVKDPEPTVQELNNQTPAKRGRPSKA